MDTYELHNPEIQLLKIREGSRSLESFMHNYFSEFSYPKRKEWFYYDDRIISEFDTLDEKNYLSISINQLKAKVSNLLKPRPTPELKRLYHEKYGEKIEEDNIDKKELEYLLADAFSFLNCEIGKFIDSLDYSEIPTELDPDTHYFISIPSPVSQEDISMDLEQILGRQRLKENPWKNTAKMFVKVTSKTRNLTKENFDRRLEEKKQNSIKLLNSYTQVDDINKHVLAKTYQTLAKMYHYKDDYVAVNEYAGLIPVFNRLMMVSEMRAFEVQQIDYADRFTVINTMNERKIDGVLERVQEEVEKFIQLNTSIDKLRKIVELSEELDNNSMDSFLSLIPLKYREYFEKMGPERIKANSFQESKLKSEWDKQHREDLGASDKLVQDILDYFKLGHRFSRVDIKNKLKELYLENGYKKTAKASDIKEYLWTKDVKFLEDGKWINGYEITGKK